MPPRPRPEGEVVDTTMSDLIITAQTQIISSYSRAGISRYNVTSNNQENELGSGEEYIDMTELQSLFSQGIISPREARRVDSNTFIINRTLVDERLRVAQSIPTISRDAGFDFGLTNEDTLPFSTWYHNTTDSIREHDVSEPFSLDSTFDDEPDDCDYSDDDFHEPRWNKIKPDSYHAHEIPYWSSDVEREQATDLYLSQIEYRLRWIFFREEREGFRRRGVKPFSRQDFLDKIYKHEIEHELNTSTSTFYDWNIGSTDFILRLENFKVNEIDAMRVHFIYKRNRLELGYQNRIWDGNQYQFVSQHWAEIE